MADAGFETPKLNGRGLQVVQRIEKMFDDLLEELDPLCYSGSLFDQAKQHLRKACGLAQMSAGCNVINQEDKLEAERAEARRAATAALEKRPQEAAEGTVEMLLPPEGAGRAQTPTT